MKFFGLLLIIWGVGYFGANFITVKELPPTPGYLMFFVGILLLGVGLMRDRRK